MIQKLITIVLVMVILLSHSIQIFAQYESIGSFEYSSPQETGFVLFSEKKITEESRYLLRGTEGLMWVTEKAIWLTHWGDFESQSEGETNQGVHIKITFPEINNLASLVPEDPLEGSVSYLIGTMREEWKTDLTMYGRLRYKNLYSGVDLVIQSSPEGFLWHYETIPGVETSKFNFQISGVEEYINTSEGTLLDTTAGKLFLPPIERVSDDYQMSYKRSKSSPELSLLNILTNEVELNSIEDLTFSSFLGGSGDDVANDVELDQVGNVYLVGTTPSADFPTVPGSFDTTVSRTDAFILKVSVDSPSLVYSTYIGGTGTDRGSSISIENGIAYVVGETNSPNFPLAGASVGQDAFVMALNQSGNDLIYSKLLGGTEEDMAYKVKAENNFAYLTGITFSNNFPVTDDSKYSNGGDIFVIKVNSSGSIEYGTYLGGTDVDAGYGLDVQNGWVWITGETWSLNFGPLPGIPPNIFVASLNTTGGLDTLRLFGGIDDDRGFDLVIDSAGDVYVVGFTDSVNFPVTQGVHKGNFDVILMKLNRTSTVFSTFVGGSNLDQGFGIDLDEFGGVIITGITNSEDFPVTASALQSYHAGNGDAFVTRFFIGGSTPGMPTYSSYLGGTERDRGLSLALGDTVNAYVTGETRSSDFPLMADGLFLSLSGTQDAFLSVLPIAPLPLINVLATTNGVDANEAPGPLVLTGVPISWDYLVSNVGEVPLDEIIVTDNQGVVVTCPQTSLIAGGSMTCSASGLAVPGQYSNMGIVTARTPYDTTIGDSDASHYFGAVPEVGLVIKSNNAIVDQPTDLFLEEGENIAWSYEVTNSGNVGLSNVTVVDNNGTSNYTGDDETVCFISTLAAGSTDEITCALSGYAIPGPYSNQAVVIGTPPGGLADVSDEVLSHYFGYTLGIDLEIFTNGIDVNDSPGVELPIDTQVTWTYEVTNNSNVAITSVNVTDDKEGSIACPKDSLEAGETIECIATGKVFEGEYSNEGTVNAEFVVDSLLTKYLTDSEKSYYRGIPSFKVYIPLLLR